MQPPKKDTKQSSKPKDKPSSSGGKAKKKVYFCALSLYYSLIVDKFNFSWL